MRALWLAVALCGCSSTLDESGLLGRPDAPKGSVDLGVAPAAPGTDMAQLPANTQCNDFSDTPPGALPVGWMDVRGTWRVALDGAMRVLQQEANSTGGNGSEFMV